MMIDRLLRDDQTLGDLRIAQSLGEQGEHLELAGGETGRVITRPWTRPARHAAHASLAQSPGDDRGRG